jgi:hypothetical protein
MPVIVASVAVMLHASWKVAQGYPLARFSDARRWLSPVRDLPAGRG